ncbi:hypothetical protein ACQKDA_15050, partial [Psychrobacter sp. NPDC078370]
MLRLSIPSVAASCGFLLFTCGMVGQVHADSMSMLIAQKSIQPTTNMSYRYPEIQRSAPTVVPAFLSGQWHDHRLMRLPSQV